jgi:hypothetical protein
MAETVEIEGKTYEISGRTDAGLPIIKGVATPFHHKDEQIFDEDGNPKISTNIDVPSILIGANPGENG